MKQLLKQAGYPPNTTYHYPITDHTERKVRELERLIRNSGAVRVKSPDSSEYQYQYDIDNQTVVFHYRFGDVGLSAWWIKYSPR